LVSLAALDHGLRIAFRCYAYQEAFVCPEDGLDAAGVNVRFQLRIHDLRGQYEGEFPKFRELPLLRIADSCESEFFSLARQAKIRWNIYDHDIVVGQKKRLGNCLRGLLSGDRLDFFSVLLDMEEVYGREDRNAVAQQLLHILPRFRLPEAL
jgi:hypothetical protein